MLDKRSKASWQIVNELKEYFSRWCFPNNYYNQCCGTKCTNLWCTSNKISPKSVASKLYKSLAKEIIKRNATQKV